MNLYVYWAIVQGPQFTGPSSLNDRNHCVVKPINESIKIGRGHSNHIVLPSHFGWISREHGRIEVRRGMVSTSMHYVDTSSNGSTHINWRANVPLGFSNRVHQAETKVDSGDWIVLMETSESRESMGIVLIPYLR